MSGIWLIALLSLAFIAAAAGVVCIVKLSNSSMAESDKLAMLKELKLLKEQQGRELSYFRQEINRTTADSIEKLGKIISGNQMDLNKTVNEKIETLDKNLSDKQSALQKSVQDNLTGQEQRFRTFSELNEQKLEGIRGVVEKQLNTLQNENSKKLDEMRQVVDEKLQKTLEDRMSQSFKLVSERLEQVYKGLGEMQAIASNVGDLKKVLSNVKSRGILGEIQLGAILKEILAPEQYEENVETKKGSGKRVEFAIKLPADNERYVYLPIDSKFPGDSYSALVSAYDTGDKQQIDTAARTLVSTIKSRQVHIGS